jgi:hypothetical protein
VLGHLDTDRIAAEIRLELAHPTQPVADIIGPMRAGEPAPRRRAGAALGG